MIYHTLWIDVRSGLEQETLDLVANVLREFKEDRGIPYAEAGMIFEKFDIFCILQTGDMEQLVDFVVEDISIIEGVLEVKIGSLVKTSNPIPPIEGEHFRMKQVTGGPTPEFRKVEGYVYYIVYLDIQPVKLSYVYERLSRFSDGTIRFYAYCLDNYNEDILIALMIEDSLTARDMVVRNLRTIDGVRDTDIYKLDQVRSL